MPLEGAKSTRAFASCSMDLITDLPLVDGCDSILVVVDRGNTKGAILIPTMKALTQEGAGQLLLDNLYKQFGLLDKMLSDRGPQFAAMAVRELLKLLGIKSNLTTSIMMCCLAPYEKSKSLGPGGSMVARLKLKEIDGRAFCCLSIL